MEMVGEQAEYRASKIPTHPRTAADDHRRWMYACARRRGASPAEADDIVQDVQLNVFKSTTAVGRELERAGVAAYLEASVARTMARRAARRAQRETPLDPELLAAIADEREIDADRESQIGRLRGALRAAAHDLDSATVEAFKLHVLAEWSVQQTAASLQISPASVYQAKSRVLKKLRELLLQEQSR